MTAAEHLPALPAGLRDLLPPDAGDVLWSLHRRSELRTGLRYPLGMVVAVVGNVLVERGVMHAG